ncbi:hypothetical protein ACRXCV_12115 [Halobacteriovorax sp. GFR7]|uniref:hypothetical protein n=1 Tax=unclassified Halobacteriovorax TaxID=2639665 RepID=UPI003D96554A
MKLRVILKSLLIAFVTVQTLATPLQDKYLKELQAIHKMEGNGSNKDLTLISKSSESLVKDWNEKLAREVARVYNELLNVNQNYFNADLIEYVIRKRGKQFMPILNKALSEKNKKVYKEMLEFTDRQSREGKAPGF